MGMYHGICDCSVCVAYDVSKQTQRGVKHMEQRRRLLILGTGANSREKGMGMGFSWSSAASEFSELLEFSLIRFS